MSNKVTAFKATVREFVITFNLCILLKHQLIRWPIIALFKRIFKFFSSVFFESIHAIIYQINRHTTLSDQHTLIDWWIPSHQEPNKKKSIFIKIRDNIFTHLCRTLPFVIVSDRINLFLMSIKFRIFFRVLIYPGRIQASNLMCCVLLKFILILISFNFSYIGLTKNQWVQCLIISQPFVL